MKKIIGLCLVMFMLLSNQVFSQNNYERFDEFVPAKVVLVGENFEISQACKIYFDVDTFFNCADFQVYYNKEFLDMMHLTISYLSDNGTVLHMDNDAICVMEETMLGKACKLTFHNPIEGFSKMYFLFYLLN